MEILQDSRFWFLRVFFTWTGNPFSRKRTSVAGERTGVWGKRLAFLK